MSKKASKAKAPPKTVVEEEDENSDEDDIYANERQTVSAFAAAGRRPVKKLRIGGGSGGGAKLSIEGPILEMKTEHYTGVTGQSVPKRRLTIANPTFFGDAAQDFVSSGYGAWLVPSMKVQSDDDDEGQKKKGERCVVYNGPETRCRQLDGAVAVSVHMKGLGDDKKNDVPRMKIGDHVRIWGNAAEPGTRKDTGELTLYLNSGGGEITQDAPAPPYVPRALAKYALERGEKALFDMSLVRGGFFYTERMSDEEAHQARVIQGWWQKHKDGAARSVKSLALGKSDDVAANLNAQAAYIESLDVGAVASGLKMFPVEKDYDHIVAPVVLEGSSPAEMAKSGSEDPYPMSAYRIAKAAKDPELAKALPKTMMPAVISAVEFRPDKTGFSIYFNIMAIPDVAAAVEAKKKDKTCSPQLKMGNCIMAEQSLKEYVKTFCRDPELVKMGISELFPGPLTGVIFLKTMLGSETSAPSAFPIGGGVKILMRESLEKGALLVSEAFVKKNLCEGSSQFVGERELKRDTALTGTNNEEMMTFSEYGVQELTSQAWKFSQLDPMRFKDSEFGVENTTVEYRVLFEGVNTLLKTNDDARMDSEAGEAALAEHVKKRDEGDVKFFFAHQCLVYAVAVEKDSD